MDKIERVIKLFEWSYETKPRLFVLGVICGGLFVYLVNTSHIEFLEYSIKQQREENEKLRTIVQESQNDCLRKIREVKEFLKEVAE